MTTNKLHYWRLKRWFLKLFKWVFKICIIVFMMVPGIPYIIQNLRTEFQDCSTLSLFYRVPCYPLKICWELLENNYIAIKSYILSFNVIQNLRTEFQDCSTLSLFYRVPWYLLKICWEPLENSYIAIKRLILSFNVIQNLRTEFQDCSTLSLFYRVSWNPLKICWKPLKNSYIAIINWILSQLFKLFSFREFSDITKLSGLENMGNTCYMNSTMQMLASSNKIIHQLEDINANLGTPNRTLNILINLLQAVNKDNSDVTANTDYLNSLIKEINWNKSSQQDSYDFLCAVINGIQLGTIEEILMPMKITIAYKFQGVQMKDRLQINLGLSLGLVYNYAVYPGVKLEDLVDNYFSPTIIDEDINKTVQNSFYEEYPEILLLHIQANKWDQNSEIMIKPKYHIQYNENIELNLPVVQDLIEKIKFELVKYKLCGLVHHTGSISGGHYVTYRKYNGNWFLIDDDQVIRKCHFQCDVCPYILLYEKDDNYVYGN